MKQCGEYESHIPANIYVFKVNNRNTRTRCEIYSKLTIKTPKTSFCCFYSKLWTYSTPFSSVSIVDFEQVNVSWDNYSVVKFSKQSCSTVLTNTFSEWFHKKNHRKILWWCKWLIYSILGYISWNLAKSFWQSFCRILANCCFWNLVLNNEGVFGVLPNIYDGVFYKNS